MGPIASQLIAGYGSASVPTSCRRRKARTALEQLIESEDDRTIMLLTADEVAA